MAFAITPPVQTLIDDAADAAVKTILLAVGEAGEDVVLQVGAAVKEAVDKAVSSNTSVPSDIQVAEAGLKVLHDGLQIGGKDTLANDVEGIEVLVENFDGNGGNAPLAAIKTWLSKIFTPKKYAAAIVAAQGK